MVTHPNKMTDFYSSKSLRPCHGGLEEDFYKVKLLKREAISCSYAYFIDSAAFDYPSPSPEVAFILFGIR